MDLPWSSADTPEEDVGHALEGTAFQGVSVFVIPRNILGAPPGLGVPRASHVRYPRTPPSAESRWRGSW